jgi:hypothetical protein
MVRLGADMLIYVIIAVLCMGFFFYLAWRAPEGEELPGVGFVEKKHPFDEQDR